MQNYNIDNTYNLLKNNLVSYLKTNYFGKNDALRRVCADSLMKDGTLCQKPYIEANPAYVSVNDGINNSSVLTYEKKILNEMYLKNLGVVDTPYSHQLKALEYFHKGNDLFVATGTGSGKTECFMWPIVTKLVYESISNHVSWNQRGVRVLILYPMNALVSDQIGRLRKMMGDRSGNFHSVCRSLGNNGRYPQFGMYTGRTPYFSDNGTDKEQDKNLSDTIFKDLVNISEESKKALQGINKLPAKKDLARFVAELKLGNHYTDDEDAELITRQEMLANCPDILITNYSMLQYMLIRNIEQPIWDSTKAWLESSPENQLLFVIDEAHMYKGASGGEVALLIRRFMHKLGIGRDRIRFILTSASIPKNDEKSVINFACNISAQSIENSKFKIILGDEEKNDFTHSSEHCAKDIVGAYAPDYKNDSKALITVCNALKFNMENCDFNDEKSVAEFLGRNLSHCTPMLKIAAKCRGNATEFSELAREAYPKDSIEDAEKATSILLSLAVLARNDKNLAFLPVRLHMFFRGIEGLYACVNSNCPDYNDELKLGKIYTQRKTVCSCGGKVYELVNDRTCGAVFLKGYFKNDNLNCVWNDKGISSSDEFSSIALYVPVDGDKINTRNKQKGWLNSKTGRIFLDDSYKDTPGFIKVIYSTGKDTPENEVKRSFGSCPHCNKSKLKLTDFATKGDEPFFHIVSEQLHVQPPTIFDEAELQKNPNAGKKVLLFSDSRQTAASLARDLTRAADEEAMKKALPLASINLENWAAKKGTDASFNLLYTCLLEICNKYNSRLFYGEDEKAFERDIELFKNNAQMYLRCNRPVDYDKFTSRFFKEYPELYSQQLFYQLCSNFRSLTDIGICWIEPVESQLSFSVFELMEKDIPLTEQSFMELFSAWANEILTDSYSLDNTIPDSVRQSITIDRLGLEENSILAKKFQDLLKNNGLGNYIDIISGILGKYLLHNNESNKLYLNTSLIMLKTDPNHAWYKCSGCGGVFPYSLFGMCGRCCKNEVHLMNTSDFEGVEFWRNPIIDVLNGKTDNLSGINTEEHTAQLSHKDQRQKTWATTEDFEIRFQNVYTDNNDKPVDVLSCTTTMEVGIDIGSLTAVGLRNIPPMRENYQQRAGRAGRRSSAISTIITYTGNGPHDSYYFNNPRAIISGDPRSPWIDVNNMKLVSRHLNVICVMSILKKLNCDINALKIGEFFSNTYMNFLTVLSIWELSRTEFMTLLPEPTAFSVDSFKNDLIKEIKEIKDNYEEFPENYKSEKDKEETVLDVFLSKGIFPTYSFPRNVIGFNIEKNDGTSIEQKPDRGLDVAISEYAPGRTLVVNKKTYKSGGLYNYHSKFRNGFWDSPAKPYFDSSHYYKSVYSCENDMCGWFGLEQPDKMECPFCHGTQIRKNNMVVPWGFAPQNGKAANEARIVTEYSYAEQPCYSLTPKEEDMINSEFYKHLRYTRQCNQPLTILNKGINEGGFTVCKLCGAAVVNNGKEDLTKLSRPYYHPYEKKYQKKCKHPDNEVENMYLGDSFITDIALFEIKVDASYINTYDRRLWLNSAALTLSEAILLAASRVLDIEYSELKSGYRLRNGKDCVYVDIYIYDGLSSGAGYSSGVIESISRLLEETEYILSKCPNNCNEVCHQCLSNYHNQRSQRMMNRHSALQLLQWCKYGEIAEPIPVQEQKSQLEALDEWIRLDGNYSISYVGNEIFINHKNTKRKLYIFPAMWNMHTNNHCNNSIAIPDILLRKALPESVSIIDGAFGL